MRWVWCFDYIMHHFCLNDVLSIDTTGSLPAKRYLHDYVGLEDGWQRYFQAGVIFVQYGKTAPARFVGSHD